MDNDNRGDANLEALAREIQSCSRCPRVRNHCLSIAREKRRAFADETYWGKPVSGFGDPDARLVIVGLAPAAHGANRTGRIFTGDRSGEWLYRALHRAGFANQPESLHLGDGLELRSAWITCAARCAPPENKPLPSELAACEPFLRRELGLLKQKKVYLALGGIALKALWPLLCENEPSLPRALPKFAHGNEIKLPGERLLLMSYHPSQQNTFTGRLTQPMFDAVFKKARDWLAGPPKVLPQRD
jgi:uracil-DNA glycosylase family 4